MAKVLLNAKSFYQAMGRLDREAADRFAARLHRIGARFGKKLLDERLSGRPGLGRRTGTLARSFFTVAIGSKGRPALVMGFQGPGAEYASIHEFGGTIRPVRKKWLAFPFPGGPAGRLGVARQAKNRPSDFGGLIFIKSRKDPQGTAFLVKPIGVKKRKRNLDYTVNTVQPYFILKKRVQIPKRLGYLQLWEREQGAMVDQLRAEADKMAKDF